jgi:hypothetical protein
MLRHGIQRNGKRDVSRSANQAEIEYVSDSDNNLKRLTAHDSAHVDNIADTGVPSVELDEDVCSVCCKDT